MRVAAFSHGVAVPAFSSRWCQGAFICPAQEGTEATYPYLEQLLEQLDVGVVVASSDATIAMLRRHREQLEKRLRLALAQEPAISIASSKEETMEIAKRLGIAVPGSVRLARIDDLDDALLQVGLPAIVKPVESWIWNEQEGTGVAVTAKLAMNREEARRAVEEFTRLGCGMMVQQFTPGERESISYIYSQGQIYARCAQWHTRIVGGQSSLRTSIAVPPDMDEQAEALVREIGLEGCAEVEFRRHPSGQLYLMEINPRLWAATELAVRSGADFPYMLYQWASSQPIESAPACREGVRLRYLAGHLSATLIAVHKIGWPGVPSPGRALLDFFLTFFLPTGYDYVDWRDPLPAWKASLGYVRNVLRRIGRRITGRRLG